MNDKYMAVNLSKPYHIIADMGNNNEILAYEHYGDYHGDFLLAFRPNLFYKGKEQDTSKVYVYKDAFGSCSGCDDFEAELAHLQVQYLNLHLDDSYGLFKRSDVKEFISDYKPWKVIDTNEISVHDEKALYDFLIKDVADELSYTNIDYLDFVKKIVKENS